MFSMPQWMKDKWVAALRSGEYKQCTNTLSDGGGYCCLGVLQMVVDGKVETDLAHPSNKWVTKNGIRRHPGCGLSWVVNGTTLQSLNDTGSTFEEIADIIEEQVVGV